MKKFYFMLCFMLIFPIMFLFAGCSTDGKIEIRINDGYVQWAYDGDNNWVNIISIEEIKDNLGEAYKGNAGKDGREIELRDFNGVIQWKYVDESDWKNLSKKNTFTVNFDSKGGTNIETISNIIENTKIKKPTDPTRDGYIFDGWYYQNEKWSFVGFPVTENMTLTAHWNPIFNLENGKILSLTPYASTLKTLNIPSKIDNVEITEIGDSAFKDNLMLEKIVISDSVIIIGDATFSGCKNIILFEGTNNVVECGYEAFYGTKWLEQKRQSDKLITLGNICLGLGKDYKSSELIIDDEINKIDCGAFSNCSNLISITIPNGVTSIGEHAFSGCSSLTSITIPNSVTSIGNSAFCGCSSLTIYCEAISQPTNWESGWNYSNRPVYWYSETGPTETGNYWHYENDEIKIWRNFNFGVIEIEINEGISKVAATCSSNDSILPGDTIAVRLLLNLEQSSESAYYIVGIKDENNILEPAFYFVGGTVTYVIKNDKTYVLSDSADLQVPNTEVSDKFVGKITSGQSIEMIIQTKINEDYTGANQTNIICSVCAVQQANLTEQQAKTLLLECFVNEN